MAPQPQGAAEPPALALTEGHSPTRRFSRSSLVVKPSSTIVKLDSFKYPFMAKMRWHSCGALPVG